MYPHILKVVCYWTKSTNFVFNLCFLFFFFYIFPKLQDSLTCGLFCTGGSYFSSGSICENNLPPQMLFCQNYQDVRSICVRSVLMWKSATECHNTQTNNTYFTPQIPQDKYNQNTWKTSVLAQIIPMCFQGTLLLRKSLNWRRLIEFSLLKAGLLPVDFYFL